MSVSKACTCAQTLPQYRPCSWCQLSEVGGELDIAQNTISNLKKKIVELETALSASGPGWARVVAAAKEAQEHIVGYEARIAQALEELAEVPRYVGFDITSSALDRVKAVLSGQEPAPCTCAEILFVGSSAHGDLRQVCRLCGKPPPAPEEK